MDPVEWLENNKKYFSEEMNGYRYPPMKYYLSTLPLVDRDGKILDLGCGNGMLLKFLMGFSGHKLEPFGVDIKEEPIRSAKCEVLPDYADHFQVSDVDDYDFNEMLFDIIITSPVYTGRDKKEYTNACIKHLNQGGRLIYRIHDDVLRHKGIVEDDFSDFRDLGMRISNGYGIIFAVFDK